MAVLIFRAEELEASDRPSLGRGAFTVNLMYPYDLLDGFILPNELVSDGNFEAGCGFGRPIWIEHSGCDHNSAPLRFTLPDDRRFDAVSDAARVSFSR
jgi:hypothetical protein